VLFLALFASQAGVLVLTPVLVEVAREFDLSTAGTGQLRTISGGVAGVTALVLGRVAGRLPLRDLLLYGAGLLALGAALSAAAPTFWLLTLAQVPLAVAIAVLVAAGSAGAGDWVGEGDRPGVLGRAFMGPPAAWIVGMPLVGAVGVVSWRLAFVALPLAAAALVAGALALCKKEELPAPRPFSPVRTLLRQPVLGRWALAELLASSAWGGAVVFGGALFVESYGTSPGAVGLVLAVVAVAYLPGNALGVRLVRRGAGARTLAALSLAIAAGLVSFGAVRPSPLGSALIFAALGFLIGGRTLVGGAVGLAAAGERRLAVMGLRTAAMQFGFLAGSLLGGIALALSGYAAFGALLGGLFAAAALTYLALSRE
jgi:predicted MFS family arabinose efflux permease